MLPMQALVLSDIAQLELCQVPRPEVGRHEVLLRVSAVGVCGTDFHIFQGLANFNRNRQGQPIPLVQQPQILGHEIVGMIEEVGDGVEGLHPGDRIVIDQGLNCWSRHQQRLCEYCASGDSHQCEFYSELGITGLPGGFAEYLVIPAVNVLKLNSELDFEVAVLTEPLGCIVHVLELVALSRTRYVIGATESERLVRSILIYGAGPAGLMFIQYLRNVLRYDGLLLVSEPNRKKRELAANLGAEVVDPLGTDLVAAVQEKTKGIKVECVIDACGAGAVFRSIAGLIRKQATVLLYGYGHGGIDLSVLNSLQFMESILICATGASGGFDTERRPLTYRKALNLLETKKIDVASLITHRYQSLETLPQAFLKDHKLPEYIKGVAVL